MNDSNALSRRKFIQTSAAVGGGLLLGFYLPAFGKFKSAGIATPPNFSPNAFIRIGTDDIITVIVNHSEMGQGVFTSLPMLIADELEADWSKIRIEPSGVDPVYNNPYTGIQNTGFSTTILVEWDRFRKAGATGKYMLIAAAAQTWNVDAASCKAERGVVIHKDSGRKLSYGQLVEKAATIAAPQEVKLKDPKDFTFIGKPVKRLDTPEKINGTAIFGIDVKVPGLLTALIARTPVFGGKVIRFYA